MPIPFVPNAGDVLMCDFDGFRPPEMTKKRHVVVLSARSRVSFPSTYVVVPVSKTPPGPVEACHCEFKARSYVFIDQAVSVWAKADMVTCVASGRLDRVKIAGRFSAARISSSDLARIRQSVLWTLGMDGWHSPSECSKETEVINR